jgi:hypothetical protein
MIALAIAVTSHAAQQLPALPATRIVFQETLWWQLYIPVIVGFLQFLMLAGLTFLIFWSNSTQKIREREAEWYHKVVVDHAILSLDESFGVLQRALFEAAKEVEALRAANVENARTRAKKAVKDAKTVIFELRSAMGFRVASFDARLEQEFTRELELLENEIVKWFTTQPEHQSYDACESLPVIIMRGQTNLLRTLMRHEFTTWGFAWPWSHRSGLPNPMRAD